MGNNEGSVRLSNVEALRLLSMLMILNLHSFWGYNHGTGFLQLLDFFRESTSICAVNAFLLISGYFGIKWKVNSFFNLLFQIFFYSFFVYLVAVGIGVINFSFSGLFANIKCLYASWGFITGYLVLYMCSPVLNSFVEHNSTKTLLVTIITLWITEIFCHQIGIFNYGIIYLIGRFLRKTNILDKISIQFSHIGYWVMTLIIFVIVICLYKTGTIVTAEKMTTSPLAMDYSSPFVIFQAIFLFITFVKMSFFNKFINWCAASCLSIFLIHMHPSIKEIGYYAITESLYEFHFIKHVLSLTCVIMLVMGGAILVDKLRIWFSDNIYKILIYLLSFIPEKLKSINTYIPKSLLSLL